MTKTTSAFQIELKTPKGSVKSAFMTEGQLANFLNLSVQFLRAARANGTGVTYSKFGNAVRYYLPDIERYIEESRQNFTGQHDNQNQRPISGKPANWNKS